jgi:hypothetical protein
VLAHAAASWLAVSLAGYSLYVKDGDLVHDLSIGGSHQIVRSER